MRVPHGESPSADLLLHSRRESITSSKDTRRSTASARPIRLTWRKWLPSMTSPIRARSRSVRGFLSPGHGGFWRLTLSSTMSCRNPTRREEKKEEEDLISPGQCRGDSQISSKGLKRKGTREWISPLPPEHPSKRQVPVK